MFGNRNARSGDDQCGGGADVEGGTAAAPSAAGIEQLLVPTKNGSHIGPHRRRSSCNFGDGFPLLGQGR